MTFSDITSEQAVALLSHYRAITQIVNKQVEAFIKGNAKDQHGELVFLKGLHRVHQLPERKYFGVFVDETYTKVKFEETLDLVIDLR